MTRRRTALQRARQMGLQAAADPKAKRPLTPEMPPAGAKSPAADKMSITKGATAPTPRPKISPEPQKPALTKKPTVTGTGGRNVSREGPSGTRTRANVTREQLSKTGLSLRDYLNFMDKKNKRPTKADAAEARAITAGFKAKKAKKASEKTKDTPRANMTLARKAGTTPKKMMGGGMMKSKMKAKGYKAGGKMKAKGYKAGGKMPMVKDPKTGSMIPAFAADGKGKMMGGGKVKSKGYKAGGKMKSKMSTKGGAKGGKRSSAPKVRGAGIARKGVRPAKMR